MSGPRRRRALRYNGVLSMLGLGLSLVLAACDDNDPVYGVGGGTEPAADA
jgi:hypothetical protein